MENMTQATRRHTEPQTITYTWKLTKACIKCQREISRINENFVPNSLKLYE